MSNAPEPAPLVGQLLDGRYKIIREIASGGMSAVYEATHVKIGRTVAIKVLHRDMAGDPEVVARFLNEARAVGTFGHPNIVASTDFGELAGHVPYLVLEYLDGHTLSHEIHTEGPLPIRRVARIAAQIASALEAAHARNVIHRDLTSANIFLVQREGSGDHVKVLDFGISKFMTADFANPKTRRGLTMGTPEFMSPEQISDPDSVDARVDVYALGVIMYQMLAGQCPFTRMPLQSLLTQILLEPPPPIERGGIPEGMRAIAARALCKLPGERFARMRDMRLEIEGLSARIFSGADSGPVALMDSGERRGAIVPPGPTPRSSPVLTSSGALPVALSASGSVPVAALPASGPVPTQAPPMTDPALATRGRGLTFVALALALASFSSVAFLLWRQQHQGAPSPPSQAALPPPPPAAVPAPPGPVHLQVISPVAQARVTLRGRTHLLPFEEDVTVGVQPEVVEITAPGHEGRRFWITFAHPIALAIDLPPGHGVVEASEEQTAIALGGKAVEGGPVAGAEEPQETTEPSEAHRHGGHHHGSGLKPAKANVAAAGEAATPPVVPPPAAPPVPAPKPAPEAAKVDAPAAPKPATTLTAKLEASPAARPKAATGVDPVKTQVFVKSHLGEIQRCYERGKMDEPDLKGRVTLKIVIAESGAVTSATVDSSSLRSSVVESCIATTVKGWKFPAPAGGPAIISYPFNLK